MIKLIVGQKGSGKTKTLIDMINAAAKEAKGNVVCVEKGLKMTYDISHSVRLIDIEHYDIKGFDAFYGFLAGVCAGNYDITDVFVDGLYLWRDRRRGHWRPGGEPDADLELFRPRRPGCRGGKACRG